MSWQLRDRRILGSSRLDQRLPRTGRVESDPRTETIGAGKLRSYLRTSLTRRKNYSILDKCRRIAAFPMVRVEKLLSFIVICPEKGVIVLYYFIF